METRIQNLMGRIAVLSAQLTAVKTQHRQLAERLTLTDREKEVLRGRDDGCVRLGDLNAIVRRVWPDLAQEGGAA